MNTFLSRLICLVLVMLGAGIALGYFIPFNFLLPFAAGSLFMGALGLYVIDFHQAEAWNALSKKIADWEPSPIRPLPINANEDIQARVNIK